jgi:hypothetical protein
MREECGRPATGVAIEIEKEHRKRNGNGTAENLRARRLGVRCAEVRFAHLGFANAKAPPSRTANFNIQTKHNLLPMCVLKV